MEAWANLKVSHQNRRAQLGISFLERMLAGEEDRRNSGMMNRLRIGPAPIQPSPPSDC